MFVGFALWVFGQQPEMQKKLQDEIDEISRTKAKIDFDTLMYRMPYMNAVFRESLRAFSTSTLFIGRTCIKDCEVSGYKFKRGMQVVIPALNIHNDEEIWEDATSFDPERFMDYKVYNQTSFVPFGFGMRGCPAQVLGEMEIKTSLFHIMKNFSVRLADPTERDLKRFHNGQTLQLKQEINLILSNR